MVVTYLRMTSPAGLSVARTRCQTSASRAYNNSDNRSQMTNNTHAGLTLEITGPDPAFLYRASICMNGAPFNKIVQFPLMLF